MDPLRVSEVTPIRPAQSGECRAPQLALVLPHTELALTKVALRAAVRMARGLDVRITLLAMCVVPFPEPLDPARGFPGFSALLTLAERAGLPVAITIVYARDPDGACDQALPPGSLIVMATRSRWRQTTEQRMAERLVRAGHRVTLVAA
jgi:hypothetical protein